MTGEFTTLSENVQMYLVAIARLRDNDHFVPLSALAEEFSISASSVNEMCRKLEKQGYLIYQPYKGVVLTQQGEEKANYILRRHRLWEVFLVEKLGFKYEAAHEAACHLEHATTNNLANSLDAFLENPVVNPRGEPIPPGQEDFEPVKGFALSTLSPGQELQVLSIEEDDLSVKEYLLELGINPGNTILLQAATAENSLIRVNGQQVVLAKSLADTIYVLQEGL
ncbi:MAG: Iron-dependent repressor IdeR [Chloroflexi bacterium]|nr:Iron-dependent repressor IdeR [Chloroflexota bacterium]